MNKQTLRCLKIVECLFSQVLDGMSNKELAAHLKTSPTNITRDAQTLIDAGWLVKLDNGRYGISTRPAALTRLYSLYMSDLNTRAEQFQHRVDAQARQMMA